MSKLCLSMSSKYFAFSVSCSCMVSRLCYFLSMGFMNDFDFGSCVVGRFFSATILITALAIADMLNWEYSFKKSFFSTLIVVISSLARLLPGLVGDPPRPET